MATGKWSFLLGDITLSEVINWLQTMDRFTISGASMYDDELSSWAQSNTNIQKMTDEFLNGWELHFEPDGSLPNKGGHYVSFSSKGWKDTNDSTQDIFMGKKTHLFEMEWAGNQNNIIKVKIIELIKSNWERDWELKFGHNTAEGHYKIIWRKYNV
jgi:hypothetical protein